MSQRPDDICPRMEQLPHLTTNPAAPPIFSASVYACDEPQQAFDVLEGNQPGYVYQRGEHPNADMFGEKIRQLHRGERVAVASSGMGALVTALFAQLESGDHIVISNQLYGESTVLMESELSRLGITCSVADTWDLQQTADAFTGSTKLLVAETIANPLLRVTDIAALSKIAHERGAKLLIDNTFATPVFCQPLVLGADWVMESVTKMINGHTDATLGVLCGYERDWQRVPRVLRSWGLASSPWDCWLSSRGLATMHLRMGRAAENALSIANWLASCDEVQRVDYPGLQSHPDHQIAAKQFDGGFGNIVTFHLIGGRDAADGFIQRTQIPFCPSLGETFTTLSHPESTSHRAMAADQRSAIGIAGGTIRLSVGIESVEYIRTQIGDALGGDGVAH